MSKLYLLNYNNYYNRIVKRSTLAEYRAAAIYTLPDVNFKPNDSCYTDQIVNISDSINPDYVVITDTVNNVETLSSRWFILESKRLRGSQYRLQLRRDVFADYNEIVRSSTLFCEKGHVPQTDPLIFNSEGNTYNQIKTSEHLLQDATKCAWLVGYCDNKLFESGTSISLRLNASTPAYSVAFSDVSAMLAAFPFSRTSTPPSWFFSAAKDVDLEFTIEQESTTPQYPADRYVMRISADTCYYTTGGTEQLNCIAYSAGAMLAYMPRVVPSTSELTSDLEDDLNISAQDKADYQKLVDNNGIIARVGSSAPYAYYKLNLQRRSALVHQTLSYVYTKTNANVAGMFNAAAAAGLMYIHEGSPTDAAVNYIRDEFAATWENITENADVVIQNTVPLCKTAPYYMFCLPYSSIDFDDGNAQYTANGALSMTFVQQLIKEVGTHVFDVQLLPYCPDQYLIHPVPGAQGVIDFDGVDPVSVTYITDANSGKVGFVYWGAPQTFTFILNDSIQPWQDVKADNETRFCRLNAPNYSSSFDFSIAKNGGVRYFHVTCTYRPYQPHIQVTPEWGGVYGQYFPDGRGLICGGDYSVDIINDAWTQYQINNKNYQLMFDRQIQTMDLQHSIAEVQDIFSAGTGILSAASSGALAGAAGGPVGMAIGGTIGGALSAVGGGIDVINNQRLRADQRSAAFDMFNYQLGNIKARPTTITKMSALVGNNKIWPFYEIYQATSREVAALTLQLDYSGMTVQAIGTVGQYTGPNPTFVRGRLIRITGLEHDAEMSQLVADELARGVYMDPEQ